MRCRELEDSLPYDECLVIDHRSGSSGRRLSRSKKRVDEMSRASHKGQRRLLKILFAFSVLVSVFLWLPGATCYGQDGDEATSSAMAEDQGIDNSTLGLAWEAIRSTKLIGVILLVMSFCMVALIAWMFFEYRRSVAIPERLLSELQTLLAQKQYTPAFDRVARDSSFLGRVLHAGVRKLPSGPQASIRAMQMVNDDQTMAMEHRSTYLATVGTLGPLIGLLGTVYGMIIAFRAMSTTGQPEATQLASGISTALFATLLGIGVAIPAISFYSLFRNRINRISLEVELQAESLLEQFSVGLRPTPHPLAVGSGTSVTPRPPDGTPPAQSLEFGTD